MSFIEHTQNWARGETSEGMAILCFGILLIAFAVFLWKFGTPNAKALMIPMFVVGLLFSLGIGWGLYSYRDRLSKFEHQYQENSTAFLMQEKQRVQDYQSLYTYTVIFSALIFLLTILAFIFTENRHVQSIVIALLVIAVSLLVIDFFSKERSKVYYEHILLELERQNE